MSASPSDSGGYIRRNLPPILVGVAALVAIVVGLFVVVDRVRDDDDDDAANVQRFAASGRFADDLDRMDRLEDLDDLEGRLQELVASGLLLGVTIDETDDGLLVQDVVDGSPAAEAGVAVGDEIREVNGERVRSVEELRQAIAAVEVGDEYELTVRRDGDTRQLTAQRVEGDALAALLERLAGDDFAFGQRFGPDGGFDFNFDGQPGGRFRFQLDEDPFEQFRLRPVLGVSVVQTNEGVRVAGVEPGSVAAEAGLEVGDIIVEVDGASIGSIEELRAAMPDLSSPAETLELRVRRGASELTLQAQFAEATAVQPAAPDTAPGRPNATPAPDPGAQGRFSDLDELERYLGSDEFLDRLSERLSERLEAAIDEAMAAQAADEADGSDAPSAPDLSDLDVFRGTVTVLTDSEITLDGPRGAISFALTEGTSIVGAAPRVGGTSSVAANADREAVLVLTTN